MIAGAIAALLLLGATLMMLAGLGVLRMPDLFTRMHTSTKGASLGVALILVAGAFYFNDLAVATKAVITISFIFLTAPVAAHMLGRAAYARKVKLWEHSVIDEGIGHIGNVEHQPDPEGPEGEPDEKS